MNSPEYRWCIVFDTASLISGVRSRRGAAYEILQLVFQGRVTIVLDYKLLLEYEDVACRSQHLAASLSSATQMNEFIQILADAAEPIEAAPLLRPNALDPDDDMVLELAVAASVDAIVTPNLRHFMHATSSFGILVLTPGEFLARLAKEQA